MFIICDSLRDDALRDDALRDNALRDDALTSNEMLRPLLIFKLIMYCTRKKTRCQRNNGQNTIATLLEFGCELCKRHKI